MDKSNILLLPTAKTKAFKEGQGKDLNSSESDKVQTPEKPSKLLDELEELSDGFKELIQEIRNNIMDYMFSRVCVEDSKSKRKYEILDKVREILPEEHRRLLTELEDTILAIECKMLEEAIFYVLDNGDRLKKTILGL